MPPALPELAQVHVLRHYDRLSQENLGADLNIDVGQGTCTMKYSPKVNDQLARSPKLTELHPLQDDSTVQGILEVIWRLEGLLREISGMDRFTLQPGAGSAAIYANVSMIRAYHAARGEGDQRDEVITTIFSHPSNAACAKTAGYKVITLYPDPDGYPDLDALKAAVSERTAALLITNPEDTGIYNPEIDEWVRVVHEAGGLRLVRPGERERHPGHHPCARGRVRPLPLQPAQDVLDAARLRRAGGRGERRDGGAGPVPAAPDRRVRRGDRTGSTTTGRRASARSGRSWASPRTSCEPTPGS